MYKSEDENPSPHKRNKKKKPFKVQYKGKDPSLFAQGWIFKWWKDWTSIGSYETKEQAEQAIKNISNKSEYDKKFDYRIIERK